MCVPHANSVNKMRRERKTNWGKSFVVHGAEQSACLSCLLGIHRWELAFQGPQGQADVCKPPPPTHLKQQQIPSQQLLQQQLPRQKGINLATCLPF